MILESWRFQKCLFTQKLWGNDPDDQPSYRCFATASRGKSRFLDFAADCNPILWAWYSPDFSLRFEAWLAIYVWNSISYQMYHDSFTWCHILSEVFGPVCTWNSCRHEKVLHAGVFWLALYHQKTVDIASPMVFIYGHPPRADSSSWGWGHHTI